MVSANTKETLSGKRYLLVYGSETGQAKAIAEDIADKSAAHGLSADLRCADAVDKEFRLVDEPILVLVCSTTGEGEPPNNAAKMLRRLRNRSLKEDHLCHLRYTILGLGDTNYTNFCQCPKDFNQRLQALGAQTFYAPGWADDGTGLDVVCDPWIEGLWPALQKEIGAAVASASLIESSSNKPAVTAVGGSGGGAGKTTASSASASIDGAASLAPVRPTTASLTRSMAPLCDAALSVPVESPPFLAIHWQQPKTADFEEEETENDNDEDGARKIHNGVPFPSATSEIFQVPIEKCWRLTSDDAVKTALDVSIGTSGTPLEHFRPGDAFAIVVENPANEVDLLLQRLFPPLDVVDVNDDEEKIICGPLADTPFNLSILSNTSKVKAEVPPFISSDVTPRKLFMSFLDIRTVPKKGFLRTMAQYAKDEKENRRLLELSSKQGSKDYDAFVRQPSLSVVDLLVAFPSLTPPLERLIENLPRLQARSYSISSSPLRCPGRAHFVFNVVEFELTTSGTSPFGKIRRGICTGMLDQLTNNMQRQESPVFDESNLESLSLSESVSPLPVCPPLKYELSVFTRPNPWFLHPDNDLDRPLLMVGPGTGVAPFLGFLQHREKLMEQRGLSVSDVAKTWLFFGCRHRNRDFLYQGELERLRDCGVLTHLVTSFSRDVDDVTTSSSSSSAFTTSSSATTTSSSSATTTSSTLSPAETSNKKYVQHRILERKDEIKYLLTDPKAMIYICGDAKNMARNVNDTFVEILVDGGDKSGMTKMSAMKHLADLRENKRYLQDVWA